jgi:hypothetical protein
MPKQHDKAVDSLGRKTILGRKRCSVKGCMRIAKAKGMCQRCYERDKRQRLGATAARTPRAFGPKHYGFLKMATMHPGITRKVVLIKLGWIHEKRRQAFWSMFIFELRQWELLEPLDKRYWGQLFPTAKGYKKIAEYEKEHPEKKFEEP